MLRTCLQGVLQRWRASAIPLERRTQLRRQLRVAGDAKALEAVHAQVRNSTRLHLAVHLRGFRQDRDAEGTLLALEYLLAAPISSVGRRLGGCPPEAPQDAGLAVTWRRAALCLRTASGPPRG